MRFAASTTPGHCFLSSAFSPSAAQGTAAPMTKPSVFEADLLQGGDVLDVDDEVGFDEAALHAHQKIGSAR